MKEKVILIILILICSFFLVYKLFVSDKTMNKVEPEEINDTSPKEEDSRIKIYDGIYLKYDNNQKALSNNNSYVSFTIDGENTTSKTLYYEITLNGEDNSVNYSNLTFNLMELTSNLSTNSYNTLNNRIIYIGKIEGLTKINKKYKIEVSSNNLNYSNINVLVNISQEEKKLGSPARELVLEAIKNNVNTWTDVDNIIYFAGSDSTVNNNYVWYSGKLWRIMCINPDGTMKLITDNMMTTLAWGNSIEYNGSWVYQWLNEDFYDTLYNASNIVVPDAIWNYTTDGSSTPKKVDTLPNQKTVQAPVGLINSYEYYVASKNGGNYLNISHRFWHITPQNSGAVRSTDQDGKQDLYNRHPGNYERGIRPSIYLNRNVEFTGSGTKSDPYKIVGDISLAKSNDLLNSRISGEYVLFDNDVYRIIDIYDNKAKIMRVDYLRNGKKGIELHIARTIVYGSPSHPQNDEWWDHYLIHTWYPTISLNYQKMIVDGTYYLGEYSDYTHYKNTICTDANLDSVKVKNCTKYTASDKVYTGKVGLIRIGEMFSAQQLDYEIEPLEMWTITPFDFQENRIIHETNSLWRHKTWGGYHVVHPTLYLKESVKITDGEGTFSNPYQISE